MDPYRSPADTYQIGDVVRDIDADRVVVATLDSPHTENIQWVIYVPGDKLPAYLDYMGRQSIGSGFDYLDCVLDPHSSKSFCSGRVLMSPQSHPPLTGQTLNVGIPLSQAAVLREFGLTTYQLPEKSYLILDGKILTRNRDGNPTVTLTFCATGCVDYGEAGYRVFDLGDIIASRPPAASANSKEEPRLT